MAGLPSTQIISTSLALAGEQRARLDAHAAGTPEATLTVLWGSLMLTISALHQAEHLRNAWAQAAQQAARLPLGATPAHRHIDHRLTGTSTVVRLWGTPAVQITHQPPRLTTGRRVVTEHVAISIGSLTFQVHDRPPTAPPSASSPAPPPSPLPVPPRNPPPSTARAASPQAPPQPGRRTAPATTLGVVTHPPEEYP